MTARGSVGVGSAKPARFLDERGSRGKAYPTLVY